MTLYMLRATGLADLPEWDTAGELRQGWDFLLLAEKLWRLTDGQRADALLAFKRSIDGGSSLAGPLHLHDAAIAELLGLLAGLEDALVGPVVNPQWLIPLVRYEELGQRVPMLDTRPERPVSERVSAVAEGMVNIEALRHFLQTARQNRCEVAIG